MKINKDIADHLFEGIKEMIDEETAEKVEVGQVSEETRQFYKDYKYKKEEMKDNIEIRVKQLEKEAERKIKREFEDQEELMNHMHKQAWERIYNDLPHLDKDGHHSIDTSNGIIKEKKKKNKNPFDLR